MFQFRQRRSISAADNACEARSTIELASSRSTDRNTAKSLTTWPYDAQTSEVDLSRFRAHGGQLGAWSETAPMQARREFLSRNPLATKDQVGNAVTFMPRAVIASNPLGPSASGSAAQCPDSVIRT